MSLDVSLYTVVDGNEVELYEANITHNLNSMAQEAGIYYAVWRPEEVGIKTAAQLLPLLKEGINKMVDDPKRFKKLDPPNGWGSYDDFIPWLKRYLRACEKYPSAKISVFR